MNKILYYALPLLMVGNSVWCSDAASTEQTPQTGSSSEQSTYTSSSSKPEDQKGWLEKLKEAFKPERRRTDMTNTQQESDRNITDGPTLGERASAAGQRAKVGAKDFAQRTRQAVSGSQDRNEYGRGYTDGPTLGERASATGQQAKVGAKDWMTRLKESVTPSTSRDDYQGTRRNDQQSSFGTTRSQDREYNEGNRGTSSTRTDGQKSWSQTWEELKRGVSDTFDTKRPQSDRPQSATSYSA